MSTAKELNVVWAKAVFKLSVLNKTLPVFVIELNEFAGIFAPTPPPVKYLIVKVVLDGAIPYVLVKIKLDGEYAVVNFDFSNLNS